MSQERARKNRGDYPVRTKGYKPTRTPKAQPKIHTGHREGDNWRIGNTVYARAKKGALWRVGRVSVDGRFTEAMRYHGITPPSPRQRRRARIAALKARRA